MKATAVWAGIAFCLVSAVSMLVTWGLAESGAGTASAVFGVLTASTFFLGLAGLSVYGVSAAIDWTRRPPPPPQKAETIDPESFWKEAVQMIGVLVSAIGLVVGLARAVDGAWDLLGESWERIPRKYRQASPVCKYVTIEPPRTQPSAARDALEVRFDDAALAAEMRPSRPIVLALKGVGNGPHQLKIHATLDGRDYAVASTIKIFEDADFYALDGGEVSLVQSSIVRRELAAASLTLPACAALPPGASIPSLD